MTLEENNIKVKSDGEAHHHSHHHSHNHKKEKFSVYIVRNIVNSEVFTKSIYKKEIIINLVLFFAISFIFMGLRLIFESKVPAMYFSFASLLTSFIVSFVRLRKFRNKIHGHNNYIILCVIILIVLKFLTFMIIKLNVSEPYASFFLLNVDGLYTLTNWLVDSGYENSLYLGLTISKVDRYLSINCALVLYAIVMYFAQVGQGLRAKKNK